MDYLKKIEPHFKYVTLYNNGGGTPNNEIMKKISTVYDELRTKESATMYGKSNVSFMATDLGCRACVSEMMQQLANWHRIYSERLPKKKLIPFKGVPDAKKAVMTTENLKEAIDDLVPNYQPPKIADLHKLKWPELKKYAAKKGVKAKKKEDIIKELNKL